MKLKTCTRILLLLVALSVLGCASTGSDLNSDMIRNAFGSYGVEVLSDGDGRRVSSLYSNENGHKVSRTYAVVEYSGEPRQAYAREHSLIVAGGSIGATFREAGWSIRKQHLFIGELDVPEAYATIGNSMQIGLPRTLATHQYLFIIEKNERSFNYATITEIHHPDYLSAADLRNLYGEILFDDSNRDSIHDFIGPPIEK
jgi:hypothetical protein